MRCVSVRLPQRGRGCARVKGAASGGRPKSRQPSLRRTSRRNRRVSIGFFPCIRSTRYFESLAKREGTGSRLPIDRHRHGTLVRTTIRPIVAAWGSMPRTRNFEGRFRLAGLNAGTDVAMAGRRMFGCASRPPARLGCKLGAARSCAWPPRLCGRLPRSPGLVAVPRPPRIGAAGANDTSRLASRNSLQRRAGGS